MYRRGWWFSAAAAVVVAVLGAGCTASRLATPIKGFSDAAKKAQTNLDKQLDAVDDTILQITLADAVADKSTRVTPKAGDCKEDSDRCRLHVRLERPERPGTYFDWPFSRGALGREVRDLMAGLVAYADGLDKIMTAETVAQIQKAKADALNAVTAFAGTVESMKKEQGLKAAVTNYAGPISELVAFGLRHYTEQVKLRAIREAVDSMEGALDDMMFVLDEASTAATGTNVGLLRQKFDEIRGAVQQGARDRKTLSDYRKAAEDLDAALQGRPKAMFLALREAHAVLANALRRRDLNLESIWPFLQDVFEEAEKFATIVKQIEEAREKEQKS